MTTTKLTKAQLQATLRQRGVSFSQSDSASTLQAMLDSLPNAVTTNADTTSADTTKQADTTNAGNEFTNPISVALNQVNISESTKLALVQLDTSRLFYWDNDSFTKILLVDLVKAICTSGIQFDLDTTSLGKLLANIAKDGVLLQPIQVSYDSNGKLVIVSGRNRTASLLLIEMLKKRDNPSFIMTIPCQLMTYPSDTLLYKAVVSANDSRRMSNTEQSLTEISAVLPTVTFDAIFSVADDLSEKQLKCAIATLARQKLSESNGGSITAFNYSLGLKSAKDSKFLLELLSAVIPNLSSLKAGKSKKSTVQRSRLKAVVDKLTTKSTLNTDDKAVSQTLLKCPIDSKETLLQYERPIQSILMLKASGVDRLARNITKAEEGSYSLKSILLGLCGNWKSLDSYLDSEETATKPTTKSEGIDLVNLLEEIEVNMTDL